jgi:hypothetical protein
MSASEARQATGAKTLREAVDVLYRQLEARDWTYQGRQARTAGYDRRRDLVHFTCTWSVPGGAGHRRLGLSLRRAIDQVDGVLDHASTLF